MSGIDQTAPSGDTAPTGAMARLSAALADVKSGRGPSPVERWNPPYCGEIDMRIEADGSWFYNGSPIGRAPLVKLFASVLRRDPERYVLVTPVERLGITVVDAPFLAVEMAVEGEGDARQIAFRTNVDDLVEVGPDNPLRFDEDERGGLKPYVLVRGGLWAKVTRSLTYDLVDLAEERDVDGARVLCLAAGGTLYPVSPSHSQDGPVREGPHP